MGSPLTKKCRGLYTATNRYDVPEGALIRATNILISKDGVIQPRWGLVPSATTAALGNVSHWHKSIEFGGNIWFGGRNTSSNDLTIAYGAIPFAGMTVASGDDGPDGYANFTSSTAVPYFDMEFIKANQNLYFNGFSALRRVQNTTTVRRAGGYPIALSAFPRPLSTALARTGTTTVTATTAPNHGYVAGLKVKMTSAGDANFGAGEFTIVTVPSSTTFTYVDATSSGTSTLAAQVFSVETLVGSSGYMNVNDRVAYRAYLTEFDTAGNEYQGEVSDRVVVTNGAPFLGTAAAKNVQLAIIFVANGPSANSKLELYRSRTAASVEPNDQMGLVYTKYLTEAERARGYIWITDINPDSTIGKALYINEDQDGAKQNANRPAVCKTVGVWGRRLVMANTFDYPTIEMQLLSTDSGSGGLAVGDVFLPNYGDAASHAWVATAAGTGYSAANGAEFTVFTGGTSSIDVKHTVLSLVDSINWYGVSGSLFTIRAGYLSTGADWPGRFYIQNALPTQDEQTSATAAKRVAVAKTTGTSTRGCFAPKLGSLNTVTGSPTRAANVLSITTSANHNFEVGEYVVYYSSWANQTIDTIVGTATQGQITAVGANTLTISNTGADGTAGTAGGTVTLLYNPTMNVGRKRNRVRVSKVGQPEAFPLLENYVDVGDPGSHILKTVQCKDSLLVFKEDGLFRVTSSGVFGEKLYAELLDPNAILWAKDSAVAIQGKVMAWLTKGVAIINEQGVEKYVSERIQDRLRPTTTPTSEPDILSYPFSRRAQAFVDEVNGLYELRVCMSAAPSAPYASTINVIYDMLNDTWVEDDLAVVSEAFYQNKRYIIQGTSFYAQDPQVYAGISTAGAVTNASFTATSVANVFGFTYTGTIAVGSLLLGAATITSPVYVLSAAAGVGTAYSPSYALASLNTEVTWAVNAPVVSVISWAPVTAGEENTLKRFMESQIMMGVRENLVAEVYYSTELVTSPEALTCKLGAGPGSSGVGGFSPYNLRTLVPQQCRVGQQLNVSIIIRTARGAWTVLGLGVSMKSVSTRVNR